MKTLDEWGLQVSRSSLHVKEIIIIIIHHQLLSQQNIFTYTSTRNESCLSRAHENIKASFKTIGQQLSNAFVNNVAARNKSKLRHSGMVRYLT